jgi:hypothetical protein
MSETPPITATPETEEAKKQAIWAEVKSRADAEGLSSAEQVQLYNELSAQEPEAPEAPETPADVDSAETGPETPEAFKELLKNAVGETVLSRIPEEMLARLQTESKLRAIINTMNEGNYGADIEGNEARMSRLIETFNKDRVRAATNNLDNAIGGRQTTPTPDSASQGSDRSASNADELTGRAARKARKRQAKRDKWAEKYRADNVPENEIEAKVDRRERWGNAGRRTLLGAIAVGGVVGAAFLVRYGVDHTDILGHKTGAGDVHGDDSINPSSNGEGLSGRQIAEQLNVPTPNLEHVNDFWNSPNFLSGDKEAMAAEMDRMLRSNPNIAAMWASQLHMQVPTGVTGMPEIPPLPDMNDASAVTSYDIKVNQLGDWLAQNQDAYMKLEKNMVDVFKTAQAGDITSADNYKTMGAARKLGYAFAGAKPSGPGQIPQSFLDTDVSYPGTKARVWMINGEAYEIQDCGQRRWINVRQYAPAQVRQSVSAVYNNAPEQIVPQNHPPVSQPPVEHPPVSQPPVEQPPIGQPPTEQPPEVHTPKQPPAQNGYNTNDLGPGNLQAPKAVESLQTTATRDGSTTDAFRGGSQTSGLGTQGAREATTPSAAASNAEGGTASGSLGRH